MKAYTSLVDFQQDIRDFMIDRPEGAPDSIRTLMRKENPTLTDTGNLLTCIYRSQYGPGDKDTVGPKLMEIAAGGLGIFARDGFLRIGKNGDALKMRMALMRDGGEKAIFGFEWPDPSEDPSREDESEPPLVVPDIPPLQNDDVLVAEDPVVVEGDTPQQPS